jgi:hypothetical protein
MSEQITHGLSVGDVVTMPGVGRCVVHSSGGSELELIKMSWYQNLRYEITRRWKRILRWYGL